ncbi:MAG: hypothetical protein IPL84_12885 [Chitinophagaceae bacterium]|nr:hypothetical protein [Chitinophagaceae bacterium]
MVSEKNILLLQLYSNGDCLYATAVARQIKVDFPGCTLTWAIADFCAPIIAGNPYVDEVLEIKGLQRNDVVAFRKLKQRFFKERKAGLWQEVFVTHNMDSNQCYYDGTIRGMILRAYGKPMTVPLQPVLRLSDTEKNKVALFAEQHQLRHFKNVILWEFAPQSGQTVLHFDFIRQLAERIVKLPSTCVLLSSASSFQGTANIIDASVLTVRENAALSHYCTLLIGCSSGITWLNISDAAKQLPMVQLLNANTAFLNAPSVDFARYGIRSEELIEITSIEEGRIFDCIKTITAGDFAAAKEQFNQQLPVQFNTTRVIVYNMLCYLQFGAIMRHCKIITGIYGWHPLFLKQLSLAILGFPFKLAGNIFRKKILRK